MNPDTSRLADPPPPRARAGEVLGHWLAAFVLANVVSAAALVATGHGGTDSGAIPTWVFAVAALAMWGASLIVVHRFVLAHAGWTFRSALGFRVAPRDAWGVLVGVASQLLLVTAVNWPLYRLFPDTFDFDKVSERARDLTDAASGAWVLVLIGLVVVGAPLVEEIVYRGMVQPGLVNSWGPWVGVSATAVLFAAVHLVPVEFPGLLAFALVLGWARHRTGALGMPIVTHMAFNATGLAIALLR